MTNDNDKLPYLAGLEQAESSIGRGWCCWGVLPVALTAVWWYFTGRALESATIIVVVLCLMYTINHITTGRAKTSSAGISLEFPRKHKFVAWADITEARIEIVDGKSNILISNGITKINIPNPIDTFLDASIWQHLRKNGKADEYVPSDDALSIWAEIPADVPRELDYYDSNVLGYGESARYQLREDFISEEWVGATARQLKKANRSANPVAIQWADVTALRLADDFDGLFLEILSSNGTSIFMLFEEHVGGYSNIEQTRFALAVIRRVRELCLEPLVVFPESLRNLCGIKLPEV